MRALVKTAITYGLHTIPVRIATMVKSDETALSNACPKCQGDIGLKNYCKGCSAEVSHAEMLKAYKISKTEKVVFTKEQIEAIKNTEKAIVVLGTMPKTSIDQRMIEGGYYIMPDEKLKKAWGILFKALATGDKAMIVNYSVRSRQRLGILTVDNQTIVLLSMAYAEQLVRVDEETDVQVTEKEIEMGMGFLKSLPPMDINTLSDDYKTKLEELIAGKPMIELKAEAPQKDETAFFTQTVTA